MREENHVDILKQHLKTSVRKLKFGCKWVFQMDNDPKHTSKVVAKWLKVCVSKEAYKPESVTQALSGGMGQNSPNLLWEACGRLPETFYPS
uniref:SJCHGC09827 protein n=1 Tax=Schistosoma japonicum TaxID=6182 RepID=Q5BQS4_SCHJA|nr:SJCHGC09827 protein [Schistosoma japonicum]